MADGEAFWVPTQSILQGSDAPLVRKPKLSENLLKKPPFRFLHDVISEVIRNTGFAKDLFDESESNSKNVKDKESKVAYLNKIIDYVAEATGTRVPVRPLKVVAGLEPELTNEFLQALGRAASSSSGPHEDSKENMEPLVSQEGAEEEVEPAAAEAEPAPPKQEEKKRRSMPRPEVAQQEEKPELKASALEESSNTIEPPIPPRPLQRPMSARKAPPKVRSNVEDDNKVTVMSSMTTGDAGKASQPQAAAKGILREGESDDDEEEEETEIIMGADVGPSNFNVMDAQQGGKLVRDIVETAQNIETLDSEMARGQGAEGGAKPTGIILGRRRSVAAEASAKPVEKIEDMEKVRSAIQKLCQSTNPLVTSIENLQEDVESMLREAKYWGQEQKIYRQKLNEANQMQNDFSDYRHKIQDLDEEVSGANDPNLHSLPVYSQEG